MLSIENVIPLLTAVKLENKGAVKAALEAGADVNGSAGGPYPPIVVATIGNNAGMVEFLLEQGADPDKPVTIFDGERALHIAARGGNVEVVRMLLNRSRADPNATDDAGCTPLWATSQSRCECVEVVGLLLEAGADPALAEKHGFIPLHMLARKGRVDVVDMMCSRAPAILNCCVERKTPLFFACICGQERMVSKMLSLGAMQPLQLLRFGDCGSCPLGAAVREGFVGVVRVMINEGGIRAVGGKEALTMAIRTAVRACQTRILRLLLTADGDEKRPEWANAMSEGRRMLHYGASYRLPAAVSVLLEAGADEAERDSNGRIPQDVIGLDFNLSQSERVQMDRGEDVAIRRMLQRGPAYRARSWAWPCDDDEADADGSDDGDTATAAAATALSTPPALRTPSVFGVRTFRSKDKNGRNLFVRLVGRYCAKD